MGSHLVTSPMRGLPAMLSRPIVAHFLTAPPHSPLLLYVQLRS